VAAVVTFSLFEIGGSIAIAASVPGSATVPAAGRGTVTATGRLHIVAPGGAVKQWSTQQPQLYTMRVEVTSNGTVVDSVNATVGFRTTAFTGADAAPPFTLNGEPLHFRGFSHHNSIGVNTAISTFFLGLFAVLDQFSRVLQTLNRPPRTNSAPPTPPRTPRDNALRSVHACSNAVWLLRSDQMTNSRGGGGGHAGPRRRDPRAGPAVPGAGIPLDGVEYVADVTQPVRCRVVRQLRHSNIVF